MEYSETEGGFDYYTVQITVGEAVFRYYFEIRYGSVTCYYNNLGVSMEREERLDFEIYPGFDTPKWAKGWSASAALGLDRGNYLGNSTGGMLTIRKTGVIF